MILDIILWLMAASFTYGLVRENHFIEEIKSLRNFEDSTVVIISLVGWPFLISGLFGNYVVKTSEL